MTTVEEVKKFRVILIEHDKLRIVKASLLKLIGASIFAIDEVHKCLASGTQRTGAALELARAAVETVAFTGTPVLNAGGGQLLIPYMELLVPFYVSAKNFIVAANAMVAFRVDTGVGKKEILLDVWNSDAAGALQEKAKHDACLYGGKGKKGGDLKGAVDICFSAITPRMIKETTKRISEGVLLVANSKEHQKHLAAEMVKHLGHHVKIFCMVQYLHSVKTFPLQNAVGSNPNFLPSFPSFRLTPLKASRHPW